MIGKIKSIIYFKPTKRCLIIEVNGLKAKTYIVDNYGNSKVWEKVRVGDCINGLEWCDEEGKIIDADSKINVIK